MSNQVEEHADLAIQNINKNMRLKKTATFALVTVKGPSGKTCKMNKAQAAERCETEGWSIVADKVAKPAAKTASPWWERC